MRKNSIKIIGLFMTFILILTSIPPQNAIASSFTDLANDALKDLSEITDTEEITAHKEMILNKLTSGDLEVVHNNLDFEEAKLYDVNESDLDVFTVPVVDPENFHEMSNVAFYIDQDQNIATQTEFYLQKSDQGTFQVLYYLDGEEIANEITEDSFTTAKDYQENSDKIQLLGWNGFADCMGIPTTVAVVIAHVCGALCVVTLGTGCLVCIGGFLGVNTGAIAGCAATYLINL